MTEEPAGPLLDFLGITVPMDEGEMVVGGAVVLKKLLLDGRIVLSVQWSDGISWLEKIGMLETAHRFAADDSGYTDDDDDD